MFALYGKSYRKVNKDQLVNNINRKNVVVELTFEYNGSQYLIRRGINPNVFEIQQDGKPIEKQAAVRDQQMWLEQNIIRMSYETFCQIVILGSANYIPFMKLTVPQRREVIENIFPLAVFSRMSEILKDRVSKNSSTQINLNSTLTVSKTELDLQKQYRDKIQMIQNNQIGSLQAEAKELSKSVKALNDEVANAQTSVQHEQQRLVNLGVSKLTELEFEFMSTSRKLEDKQRDIARLTTEEDVCPTCGSKIDPFLRMKHLGEHKTELSVLEKHKQQLDEDIWAEKDIEPNRKDAQQKIQVLNNLIAIKKQEIKTLTQRGVKLLSTINEMKKDVSDVAEITTKINQLVELITQKQAELAVTVNESIVQGHCSKLLKDNGLKAAVIKRYIVQLNTFIAKYLELLNYSVGFELNENFEETIRSRNKDLFTYQSFSMGQRARVDLALLFAWRDVAKLRSRYRMQPFNL